MNVQAAWSILQFVYMFVNCMHAPASLNLFINLCLSYAYDIKIAASGLLLEH